MAATPIIWLQVYSLFTDPQKRKLRIKSAFIQNKRQYDGNEKGGNEQGASEKGGNAKGGPERDGNEREEYEREDTKEKNTKEKGTEQPEKPKADPVPSDDETPHPCVHTDLVIEIPGRGEFSTKILCETLKKTKLAAEDEGTAAKVYQYLAAGKKPTRDICAEKREEAHKARKYAEEEYEDFPYYQIASKRPRNMVTGKYLKKSEEELSKIVNAFQKREVGKTAPESDEDGAVLPEKDKNPKCHLSKKNIPWQELHMRDPSLRYEINKRGPDRKKLPRNNVHDNLDISSLEKRRKEVEDTTGNFKWHETHSERRIREKGLSSTTATKHYQNLRGGYFVSATETADDHQVSYDSSGFVKQVSAFAYPPDVCKRLNMPEHNTSDAQPRPMTTEGSKKTRGRREFHDDNGFPHPSPVNSRSHSPNDPDDPDDPSNDEGGDEGNDEGDLFRKSYLEASGQAYTPTGP
ncbi:hypothetical protein BU24DRAFT_469774 [Aaosphaeria arxii CBS 175.79]|uniref:Uncharacterized protein n=1 Tax=Aaosphaeria arxii CBS 175.79 TaxID=1450172 RepID=A0A6A5Y6U9_9PLEO|nr:uncharacterized protein BU24DRAFT_469774 [Aaosphaeria arxii CBS 175.79]KAF2021006.1 hypothetical protein BU24DRAFT_469774 [Aaosphaeria arxii CBS 175.79]